MKEIEGDLWQLKAEARCITTNGTLTQGKFGVMGKGVALQAKQRFPFLEVKLGVYLQRWGNHTGVLVDAGPESDADVPLVILPTKHQWSDHEADLELIERSCYELVALTDARGWKKVVLPRPGCGAGKLYWIDIEDRVGRVLKDDRFYIVERSSTRGA